MKYSKENGKNVIKIIFAMLTTIAAFFGFTHKGKKEKQAYNNGFCPICHSELLLKGTDEKKGRIYNCLGCGYKTFVKGNADKNYNHK